MVRDQVQTRELLLGGPADPAVAGARLERIGLPAERCQPLILEVRNVAQRLAEQTVIRQIVVCRHQRIPFLTFCIFCSWVILNLHKINI